MICMLLVTTGVGWGQEKKEEQKFSDAQLEHFETKIRPLLAKRCFECHGPDADEAGGGLRLTSRAALLKGGDTGPAIVPGKPTKSVLIDAINYGEVYEMPPDSKMPAEEIALLTEWVKQKAPWPEVKDEHLAESNAFDLAERKKNHWSWQAARRPELPVVENQAWPRDDLDRFILAQNEKAGLKMAEPADRATWIRRVYFDLIGLPPTPQQVKNFVNDPSADAFEKVVDSLLDSEHFGERWTRHWMDLIRYAETCGHEFEYPIPHAHQYRSYLIRAFNEDVPYDQFVREQIAGDLIENPRLHPVDKYNESILGTGFWFLHEATHAPVDVRLDEANHIDNRIDVMSKTFLGLTVACARCHDHKFDAISTKDYYALAGFLQSSRRQLAMLDPHGKIRQGTNKIRQIRQSVSQEIRASMSKDLGDAEEIKKYLLAANQVQAGQPRDRSTLIEGESVKVLTNTGGQKVAQEMTAYGSEWSGNKQLFWIADKPDALLKFEINAPEKDTYKILASITKAPDYGIFQVLIDDKKVGSPIDGYHPKVILAADQLLGQIELTEGKHVVSVQVVGTNKQSRPKRFMVGLDCLELISTKTPVKSTTQTTKKSELDSDRLQTWNRELKLAANNDSHPLWLWQQVTRNGSKFDKGVLQRLEEAVVKQKQLRESTELPYVFADFNQPNFGEWFVTGEAFGTQPTQNGHWVAGQDGAYLGQGFADSSQYSRKLHGVLRSPTFELNSNEIWYRIKGNNVKVRVIIDGYVMDVYNGLIFGGVSININTKDQFQWVRQAGDLHRYKGHRAHIEIIDQGGGYAVVDQIVFANRGQPPYVPEMAAKLIPAVDGAQDLADFATRYATAISKLEQHGLVFAAADSDLTKTIANAQQMIAAIEREIPNPILAPAITDGTGEDEHVFVRGNHKALGPKVKRRFLEALTDSGPSNEIKRGSGRMKLADQIASADNPFTSRVIVNRLWHHLFGRGVVASTDNFGVLGQRPSNQELLDYLATEFVSQGWSMKKMIRRMVLSQTYRMSSKMNPAALEIDPDNIKLHRMSVRRLQGEAIRDSILAVSGRLDRTVGGPSVPLHLTQFMQGRGRPGRNGPLDGNGRRSLYIEIRRNFLPPMLVAFDMPIPFNSVGRRNLSNVPAQALILMNDPFVVGQAELWAKHLVKEVPDVEQRIEQMYLQAFARTPTKVEVQNALEFLQQQMKELRVPPENMATNVEIWKDLCHVMFNVKEFIYLK